MIPTEEQDSKLSPTREGERLLAEWFSAQTRAERARMAARNAEDDLVEATAALTKWMLPKDAKDGEKVLMWHGRHLIQVEKNNHRSTVMIREER